MAALEGLGEALVALRKASGVTLRDLARRMGYADKSSVRSLEAGNPTADKLGAYLDAVGADLYDLANMLDRVTGRVSRSDAVRQEIERREALADLAARLQRQLEAAEAEVEKLRRPPNEPYELKR